MKRTKLLLLLLPLSVGVWTYQYSPLGDNLTRIPPSEKHRGVCWVGSPRPLEGWELDSLTSAGVTHISQTPFGWQEDPKSPDIRWEKHSDRMWWGESRYGVAETTLSGREKGVESILKPHLWVKGAWPGVIQMDSEEDWKDWFNAYGEFIRYYATMAQEQDIPVLCIGTELELTSHRETEWRELIESIRQVYSGQLTYAANFTEYDKVAFWDALDYIGIQAYFPLATKNNPDIKTLVQGWNKQIKAIEKVQKRFEKPVIFTEIGYCNTVDAAIEPWVWPNERKEVALSEEVQAKCYEAFFETVWKKDWLAGVYFWKWYPNPRDRQPDFTPQGKPAQQVMAAYFLGVN
jgi:hypothetical protein